MREEISITPMTTYSPELNPVERVWAYLKSHYLSNRVFVDYDDLLAASRTAWNALSEECLRSICREDRITHEIQD